MWVRQATNLVVAFLWVAACNPKPSPTGGVGARTVEPKADAGGGNGSADVAPLPGDRPMQIVAGASHFCVRLESGGVTCWGKNTGGQLGDGTVSPAETPVRVRGVEDAERLLKGGTCALTKTEGTTCWADVEACVDCQGVEGVRRWRVPDAIAASRAVGVPAVPCFVTSTGALQCPGAAQSPPADMPPLNAVHVGHDFVCGEAREGSLACYWRNREGGARFDPKLPASDTVAAGVHHVCVIDDEARVHCWGDRLRSGYAAPEPDAPRDQYGPVAEIDDLRARTVAAGYGHTCAITDQGEVVCWGRQSHQAAGGQALGRWTLDVPGATALAVGYDTACAVVDTGEVYCWGLVDEVAEPRRPQRISGLPVADDAQRIPPRDTAPQLHDALAWADSPRRRAALAALDGGLVLGSVRDGKWQPTLTACFAEQLHDVDLTPRIEGAWSCDAALSRCVAQRDGDATVFRWADDDHGARALQAVIDYDGTAPSSEPPAVKPHLDSDLAGCGLWRALWHGDVQAGDAVTVLHHPENDLSDTPGAPIVHLCGEEARRAVVANTTIDPRAADWRCEGLVCSYDLGQWARGVFVFQRDASGTPTLSIVGDDFGGDDPSVRPLLGKAKREAKRHRCP